MGRSRACSFSLLSSNSCSSFNSSCNRRTRSVRYICRLHTRAHTHARTHARTHSHICTTTGLIPPSTRLGPTSAPGTRPHRPLPQPPGPHISKRAACPPHRLAPSPSSLAATVPSVRVERGSAGSERLHAAQWPHTTRGIGAREGRRVRGTNLRPSSCRPCRRACRCMRSFPAARPILSALTQPGFPVPLPPLLNRDSRYPYRP